MSGGLALIAVSLLWCVNRICETWERIAAQQDKRERDLQ